MKPGLQVCNSHHKFMKFYCTGPCKKSFCLDCAAEHSNHIIRDLIKNTTVPEIQNLLEIKNAHLERMDFIHKIQEKAAEQYSQIDINRQNAINEVENDYKMVLELLNSKYKDTIANINQCTSERKICVSQFINSVQAIKNASQKNVYAIDCILKQPEGSFIKFNSIFSELLNNFPQIPELKVKGMSMISLLRHKEGVIDSI
jgi:hypothetical protein